MLSARAIEPGASVYEMQIGVEFRPGPGNGNLVFDAVDEGWARCNSRGLIEIEIEKINSVAISFVANTTGLAFEGFVLIPVADHLGDVPSTEGFNFSANGQTIIVGDRYLGNESLGLFAYKIFYRFDLSSTRIRDFWDPEIVNRGGIGDSSRRAKRWLR